MDQADPTLIAGRAVISDPPGGVTTIALYSADEALEHIQFNLVHILSLRNS